ncbi:uncharacterized protein H6S33_005265 [Morchella sextelata]|uniref:uncharacterized protein n=1 Tax=Morchella sextelata TaxID=1174677 RepID=UPI001D04E1F1|nr:uncharacterized protein H6S33_005265 [Morchella sextelata]KAH0605283.1 hypothetical protein H6S33_005265 [Morchella sextelata]
MKPSLVLLLALVSGLAEAANSGDHGHAILLPRQSSTAATTVDFTNFPICANHCLTRWRALGCSTNPPSTDCFCGKPNPLSCATDADTVVPAACWTLAETWYASQCPSVPAVNTAAIPTCAQTCFADANTHCVNDLTKNCICSYGQPSCGGNCTTTDSQAYDTWWSGECLYNLTSTATTSTTARPTSTGSSATSADTSTTTSTSTTAPTTSSGGGVSTGAIVGAVVGGLAGTLAIGALLFFLCRGKKPEKDKTRAAPSNYAMMGPDGKPIVEMGVEGGVVREPVAELMADVQRPVEVPGDMGKMGHKN